MSNVLINVVSEFDAKGFKQADSSFAKLTKSVAKFTAGLGLAYKTQQAMFNAMADEKATKILAQNLKNLGMAFAVIPAEQFIKQMQRQTGILDDELRPAYATLARVTGDMVMTQKIMATAFDVSAGTGQDFSTVISTLAKAYQGNTKGLRSLNIGLTTAELQTKSFSEIIEILNKQFTGAGAASLDTYAGKYAVLKATAADASEIIGGAFLDAIQIASGSTGVDQLSEKLVNLANQFAYLTNLAGASIATILNFIKVPFIGGDKARAEADRIRKELQASQKKYNERNMKVWYPEGFQTPEMKKAAAAALARSKQVLANNKKLTAEKKKQLEIDKAIENAKKALGGATNIFDLDRVSVQAAMMNQTLTDNERKRLEIKQAIFALEDAIDSQDAARITKQTDILNKLVGQFSVMQSQASLLAQIKNAYDALGMNKDLINIKNLQEALDLLLKMNSAMGNKTAGGALLTQDNRPPSVTPQAWSKIIGDLANASAETTSAIATQKNTSAIAWDMAVDALANGMSMTNALSAARYTGQALDWWIKQNADIDAANSFAAGIAKGQTGVTIQITENAKNLVDVIYDTVTEQSASGNPPIVTRVGTSLAW